MFPLLIAFVTHSRNLFYHLKQNIDGNELQTNRKLFEKNGNARKRIYHGCFGVDKKSITRDHCWVSLDNLVMLNSDPSDRFFYPH